MNRENIWTNKKYLMDTRNLYYLNNHSDTETEMKNNLARKKQKQNR